MAQNILKRYPDADLRVYVIWVKRWVTDTRAEIDGAGMVDPRVTHLWDAMNVVGLQFLERFGSTSGWTTTSSCCSTPLPAGARHHPGR